MKMKSAKQRVFSLLLSILAILCWTVCPIFAEGYSVALAYDSSDSVSARVVIDKKEIDVGAVRKDSLDRRYTVMLRNSGYAPLNIKDVSTSCFCTLVDYPKEKILPGDSVALDIILQTKDMSYAQIFIREIYVETNDPQTPCDTIVIKGSVIR